MKNDENAKIKQYKKQSEELIKLIYKITGPKLAGKTANDFSQENKELASAALTLHGALKTFAAVCS